MSALNALILLGWVLLAIGAYLSEIMGLARCVGLGLMSSLMMGVLKGSSVTSVIAATGLCVAFVPLGFDLARTPSTASARDLLLGIAATIILVAALFYFGELG